MIRRSRSDMVEELKRFACKIEARGRKEKKRIVDEKTLFVCESCGQFLSLPFERDRGERSSSWGRERKKNDFNFFSTATAELHTGGSSNGTRHGERSFEESVSRLNRYRTFSREI